MKHSHAPRVLIAFFVSGALSVACAQTQADVDAQKLRADLAAEQQRESDARAAIAKSAAAEATAAASAQAQLNSDQTAAAKAKSDYYLSMVPDPSKYKIADPKVPKLAATASRLAYTDASNIATAIANDIALHVPNVAKKCTAPVAAILPDDNAARAMMIQSNVTRNTLILLTTQLDDAITDLKGKESAGPAGVGGYKVLGVAGAMAVGQLALSIATIAKPQYAFDTASTQSASDAILRSKVIETVLSSSCFKFVDPSWVVYVPDPSDTKMPQEAAYAKQLLDLVTTARAEVRTALDKAKKTRPSGAKPTKPAKAVQAYTEQTNAADAIEAQAKTVTGLADDAQKALLALYAVDAQGGSPIDMAIRGGLLVDTLSQIPTYTLAVKTVASDMDSAAKDSLFTSMKVSVSSNTVVKWQLVDTTGQIATAGALSKGEPQQPVAFVYEKQN